MIANNVEEDSDYCATHAVQKYEVSMYSNKFNM